MKKAVIVSGNKQYLVTEGDQLAVDRLAVADKEKLQFDPLLVIDGQTVAVGQPTVAGFKVDAEVINPLERQPKVVAIRFKAKKRVHKRRGERPQKTIVRITKIKSATSGSKPVDPPQG